MPLQTLDGAESAQAELPVDLRPLVDLVHCADVDRSVVPQNA
mgnify:CR=1 FL=1